MFVDELFTLFCLNVVNIPFTLTTIISQCISKRDILVRETAISLFLDFNERQSLR